MAFIGFSIQTFHLFTQTPPPRETLKINIYYIFLFFANVFYLFGIYLCMYACFIHSFLHSGIYVYPFHVCVYSLSFIYLFILA